MLGENTNVKNWIVLTLQNVDANNDSYIDLFTLDADYSGTTQYLAQNVAWAQPKNPIWKLQVDGNSVQYAQDPATIADLVALFNADYQENGSGVFSFVDNLDGTFDLVAYSNDYVFTSITNPLLASTLFVASSSPATGGSSVVVTSDSSISMNDITQELLFQPYLLLAVNVYANTMAQTNNELQLRDYEMNGTLRKTFQNPAVVPSQAQFALENIELNYIPDPTNKLRYKVDAGETVKMIFKYYGGSVLQIKEIQKDSKRYKGLLESGDLLSTSLYDSYDERNNETVMQAVTPKIKRMHYTVTSNPMMLLIVKHNPEIRPLVADLLHVHINNEHDVTKEEVENGFLDTDFKEVG
jgi:hypothetical protein